MDAGLQGPSNFKSTPPLFEMLVSTEVAVVFSLPLLFYCYFKICFTRILQWKS